MKRIFAGFAYALILMMTVMYSPVFAQEATSGEVFEPEIVGNLEIPVNGWRAEFALDPDAQSSENQVFFLWSEEVGRQMEFQVTEVKVQDDGTIRWKAQCIFDSLGGSHVGRWLVVELEPAISEAPQRIGWDWSSGYQEENAQAMLEDDQALPFLWTVTQGTVSVPRVSRS